MQHRISLFLISFLFPFFLFSQEKAKEVTDLDNLLTYNPTELDSLVNEYYDNLEINDSIDIMEVIEKMTYGDRYELVNFDSIIQHIDWNQAMKHINWNAAMKHFDWNQMMDAMCNSEDSLFKGSPLKIDFLEDSPLHKMDFFSNDAIAKCQQMKMDDPATTARMMRAMNLPCLMNFMNQLQNDSLGSGFSLELFDKMQGKASPDGTPNLDMMCQLTACIDMNIMYEDFDWNCMFSNFDFNLILQNWKMNDFMKSMNNVKLNQGLDTVQESFKSHPIIGLMDNDSISHYFSSAFKDFFSPQSLSTINQNFTNHVFLDNWTIEDSSYFHKYLQLVTHLLPQFHGDNQNTRYLLCMQWLFYEMQLAANSLEYESVLPKQRLLKDVLIHIINNNSQEVLGEELAVILNKEMLLSGLASVEQSLGNTLASLGQHTSAIIHLENALSINQVSFNPIDPTKIEQTYFQKTFSDKKRLSLLETFKIDTTVLHLSLDDLLSGKQPKIVAEYLETKDYEGAITCYQLLKDLLLEAAIDYKVIPEFQLMHPAANKPLELVYLKLIYQNLATLLEKANLTNDSHYEAYCIASSELDGYRKYQYSIIIYNNLGVYYAHLNNYELSLFHLNEAWKRIKNIKKINHVIPGREGIGTIDTEYANSLPTPVGVATNIGYMLAAQKKYKEAIDFLQEAESEIRQKAIEEFIVSSVKPSRINIEENLFTLYLLLSQLHLVQKNTIASKAQLLKCEAITKLTKIPLRAFHTALFFGNHYGQINQLDSALVFLKKAKMLAKATNSVNMFASIDGQTGKIYEQTNQPQLALQYFDSGIKVAQSRSQYAILNQLYTLKGIHYFKQQKYAQALLYFEKSIQVVEDSLFSRTLGEGSRQLTLENSFTAYEGAIRTALKLGQVEKAFNCIQQSKSRTLNELLATTALKSTAIPYEIQVKKQDLTVQLNINQQEALIFPDSQQIQQAQTDLLSQMKITDARIRAASPTYAQLMKPKLATVTELQQNLQANQAFIEYFYGEVVYAFVITKDSFSFIELGGKDTIQKELTAFKDLIDSNNFRIGVDKLLEKRSVALSQKLSSLLISPIQRSGLLKEKEQLIIAPDNTLYLLPFELLVNTSSKDSTSYLINEFNIIYTQSATTYAYAKHTRNQKAYPKELLVIGKSDFSDYGNLNNLKPIKQSIFNLTSDKVDFLLEQDATLSNFQKLNLTDYRYIYFSTHGLINPNPDLSYLALTERPLYVHNTTSLDLKSELLILSACQTGKGVFRRGAGIMGFTRGFMYAGTESIIISLWPVDDQATETFFELFFQFLATGKIPAAALRATKLTLMNHEKYKPSFYWAGFVLFGD